VQLQRLNSDKQLSEYMSHAVFATRYIFKMKQELIFISSTSPLLGLHPAFPWQPPSKLNIKLLKHARSKDEVGRQLSLLTFACMTCFPIISRCSNQFASLKVSYCYTQHTFRFLASLLLQHRALETVGLRFRLRQNHAPVPQRNLQFLRKHLS